MELLAHDNRLGSVEKCRHGVVHLNVGISGVSLYFTTDTFMSLAAMVKHAASKIMDEGLADLLTDIPGGEKEK
ncbi:MAG: hypothetical protein HQ594_00835 [Candidatus Omnitrophica bacterium]|nr:hypothetical protein [Candidatus Omnitrophota bacterium]